MKEKLPERTKLYLGDIKSSEDLKEELSEKWAWLAGIIDGEGTIYIGPRKGRKCKAVTLGVSNTEKEIIKKCVEITGYGKILTVDNSHGVGGKKAKILYRWRIPSRKCLRVLKQTYPFHVSPSKKLKAKEIIDYFEDMDKHPENHRTGFKQGHTPWNKGKKLSPELRKLISVRTKQAMKRQEVKEKMKRGLRMWRLKKKGVISATL